MLFLIRAAFWLMIIVLLLPTDDRQRSEVYGTAQAAVNDVASFCDRNPLTFSGTPIKDYRAPPLLGAHTRDVLASIGYDDAKVETLKKQGIV